MSLSSNLFLTVASLSIRVPLVLLSRTLGFDSSCLATYFSDIDRS